MNYCCSESYATSHTSEDAQSYWARTYLQSNSFLVAGTEGFKYRDEQLSHKLARTNAC